MGLWEEISNKNFHFFVVKSGNLCLRIPPEAAKDIRKDDIIFQVSGSAPAPPTPPVFRVVLYHSEAIGQRLLRRSV